MKNIVNSPTTNTSRLGLFLLNSSLLLAALSSLLISVIGVYHALIFVIAGAWTPLFLYAAPTITLMAAVSVVYARQPVHSLVSLITVFFITTILYIYAGAEFLAFLFLIVYVGAIAILFLFVIILLQIKNAPGTTTNATGNSFIIAPVVAIVIVGLEDFVTQGFAEAFIARSVELSSNNSNTIEVLVYYVNYKFTDIFLFSTFLYTRYSFLLFLAALLLLTAIIGAIVLAMSSVAAPNDISNITPKIKMVAFYREDLKSTTTSPNQLTLLLPRWKKILSI